ncbi:NAD-dependent epimerase/dehydratase family protein [Criblamydia sequanensis]|uniref:NAD-dependent epimerase/dehydratase n=1 Tax=Candidatus Criblamydia sequanensis CRIB-18 TaxID=1437425 RepID=A0A090E134_9BACT|nr:NAD(P)-dependent oxidoreductase [Criblamydia sequanensis]CDR34489.1 Putative NAD-dependent epimerase/dehydratase [Criblamydia sequanensis CRIB-18]
MKILFTGGSSFTGYWFIKALQEKGHTVVAPLLRPLEEYQGQRLVRVKKLQDFADVRTHIPFGSPSFNQLIEEAGPWDLFCHHGAFVNNYKCPLFNYSHAMEQNTKNLEEVLRKLKEFSCKRCILTGTVFEADEGLGEKTKEAFSPYGLSKGLTWQIFRFLCKKIGLPLSKFVIANPFGPYEEDRFTTYLIKTWAKNEVAAVKTPFYIRDNVPVSLLSLSYAYFAENKKHKLSPSAYAEPQSAFALRFASEMKKRLPLSCLLTFAEKQTFEEPKKRIACHKVMDYNLGWSESKAWDELANWYRQEFLN